VSRVLFTGERLHEGSALFAVDLARHRAAYRFAARHAAGEAAPLASDGIAAALPAMPKEAPPGREAAAPAPAPPVARALDLGCGSGYGVAELAGAIPFVVGVDRILPDPGPRSAPVRYLRADLNGLPLAPASFDLVVSFQVIEHLEDPAPYLQALARLLRSRGTAILTTPNRLTSDGENPFHVREYEAAELRAVLAAHFEGVELLGVEAGPAVAPYFEARLHRIRRIVRLDPLGLRRRIPRGLVEWLFARLALRVRRGIQQGEGLPDATWRDFPIGPLSERCLDLLAVCRGPRPAPLRGPTSREAGP
jgi:SAM-dependent methyltransferase